MKINRKIIFLFCLLFATCSPPPDAVSESGVYFYWASSEFSIKDVNKQEQWFIKNLLSTGRYTENQIFSAISQARVYVYAEKFFCSTSSPTGWCNGLQDGYVLSVVNINNCVAHSAYTHELMHLIQYSTGKYDFNHAEEQVWIIADGSPNGC